MADDRTTKKAFWNTPDGKSSARKLRKRRLDEVEKDLRKICWRLDKTG
jgi:hypothetical protein